MGKMSIENRLNKIFEECVNPDGTFNDEKFNNLTSAFLAGLKSLSIYSEADLIKAKEDAEKMAKEAQKQTKTAEKARKSAEKELNAEKIARASEKKDLENKIAELSAKLSAANQTITALNADERVISAENERDRVSGLYRNYTSLVYDIFDNYATRAGITNDERSRFLTGSESEPIVNVDAIINTPELKAEVDKAIEKVVSYEYFADVVERSFKSAIKYKSQEEIASYYKRVNDGGVIRTVLDMEAIVKDPDEYLVSTIDDAIEKANRELPQEKKWKNVWKGIAIGSAVLGAIGTTSFGVAFGIQSAKNEELVNQNNALTEENQNKDNTIAGLEQEKANLQSIIDTILDKMGNYHEDLKGSFKNEDGSYNINDILAVLDSDHNALNAAIADFNSALNAYDTASTWAQGVFDEFAKILTPEQMDRYIVLVETEDGGAQKTLALDLLFEDDELAGSIVCDYLRQSKLHEAEDAFGEFIFELIGSEETLDSCKDENGNINEEKLKAVIDNAIDPAIQELELMLGEGEVNYTLSYTEKINLQNEIDELKEQKEELFNAIMDNATRFAELNGEKEDLAKQLEDVKKLLAEYEEKLESEGQSPEQNESGAPEIGAGSVSDATENGRPEDAAQSGNQGDSWNEKTDEEQNEVSRG